MNFNSIRSIAVAATVAIGAAVPFHAVAAAPTLTNLLEELTTWAAVMDPAPPGVPNRFGVRPNRAPMEFARAEVRHALPLLWLAAGQADRAERVAGSAPEEFNRAGDQANLATALFAARRDADALRVLEAASTDPLNLRSETLLAAAIARLKSGDALGADALMEKAIVWRDTNRVAQPASLLGGFAEAQIELRHTNEALASLTRAVQWAKTNHATGDMLAFTLRDLARAQARLGHQADAMATADLIAETEQRLTARLFVVQAYAEAGDAEGAVRSVRAILKADAPALARTPFAIYAPVEAAAALAESDKREQAVGFLEECIAAVRSQPMDAVQEAELQRSVATVRGMLVSRLLLKDRQPVAFAYTDPRRLDWIAELARKLNSDVGHKAVAVAREANHIWGELRAGRVPDSATLDVSTQAAVERAQRWAFVLINAGREEEALRIATRLSPAQAQEIHESAVRAALTRTNFMLARELSATLTASSAVPGPGGEVAFQLSLNVTHALAAAGRTNAAAAVLQAAMSRAQTGPQTAPNHWLSLMRGAVMQADLGLLSEALTVVTSGEIPMMTMGGPKIGRRMARQLGPEAAIDRVRKLGSADAGKLVLLGIAQEMAKLEGD